MLFALRRDNRMNTRPVINTVTLRYSLSMLVFRFVIDAMPPECRRVALRATLPLATTRADVCRYAAQRVAPLTHCHTSASLRAKDYDGAAMLMPY